MVVNFQDIVKSPSRLVHSHYRRLWPYILGSIVKVHVYEVGYTCMDMYEQ